MKSMRSIAAALCLLGCSASGAAPSGNGNISPSGGSGGVAAGGTPAAMAGSGGFAGSTMPPPPPGGSVGAGGAGATPTGGAGATPPSANPPEEYPYDTSIHFDWTETEPPAGPCLPGVYEGTFTCELQFIPGLPGFAFTGPVKFTLAESENGEFLEITDGVLEGDAGGILFTSTLAGQLDCPTDAFSAQAIDGTYEGAGIIPGTFTGTLDATLERSSQLLNGTWSLTATGQAPCVGPWSARRVQ